MSRIWLPLGSIVLSYVELLFFQTLSETFSTTFSVIYDFASFGIHGIQRMRWSSSSYFASRLQFLDMRQFLQMDVPAMSSRTKKQCFQHVRPPTFRTKFHHSSMAMMTCQLSECERYHPVRRWWNHFIIYKNHPST